MDAFGRTLAVALSAVGVVFLLLFYKTAPVRWQRTETVRSITKAYAESVLSKKTVSYADWEAFQAQLGRLGSYRAELAVYERKRFEGENGRIYLFTERSVSEGEIRLSEGSYIRIVVTEDVNSKAELFFRGNGCTIIAGGRVA